MWRRWGFPPSAVAVDAGCGKGEYAIELARRFGFHVTGIDAVPRLVDEARLSVPPGCPVTFKVGSVEDLPLASGSVDLIWSRDVLSLIEDQGGVYRECRRVLKAGGRALIYQMFTTSLLQPSEADFLLQVMACSAAAMHPENAGAAMRDAGLRIDRCVVLGSQWGEYYREHAPGPRSHLLQAARLLRDPDRYITRFGKENYDIKLGDCPVLNASSAWRLCPARWRLRSASSPSNAATLALTASVMTSASLPGGTSQFPRAACCPGPQPGLLGAICVSVPLRLLLRRLRREPTRIRLALGP